MCIPDIKDNTTAFYRITIKFCNDEHYIRYAVVAVMFSNGIFCVVKT